MSQIDIMPTVFGLLNFSYESKFYGQDVLKADYKPRALIATYQDLGMIRIMLCPHQTRSQTI
jgi:phosphoglycerol transferase MdoB-like AlkP superfamily enzyme